MSSGGDIRIVSDILEIPATGIPLSIQSSLWSTFCSRLWLVSHARLFISLTSASFHPCFISVLHAGMLRSVLRALNFYALYGSDWVSRSIKVSPIQICSQSLHSSSFQLRGGFSRGLMSCLWSSFAFSPWTSGKDNYTLQRATSLAFSA